MSASAVDEHGETAVEERIEREVREHPTERNYVTIAVWLAFLTGLEVMTYYVDIGDVMVPALLILMVVKFFLVCGWFMHLRFDSNMFTRVFVGGLALATGVYLAMLSAFEFWDAF